MGTNINFDLKRDDRGVSTGGELNDRAAEVSESRHMACVLAGSLGLAVAGLAIVAAMAV
jgi:hypothetical protein